MERFQRTQEEECLQVYRPVNLEQTWEGVEPFRWHYNGERPNQALTCGNRPPYQAFLRCPAYRLCPTPSTLTAGWRG